MSVSKIMFKSQEYRKVFTDEKLRTMVDMKENGKGLKEISVAVKIPSNKIARKLMMMGYSTKGMSL